MIEGGVEDRVAAAFGPLVAERACGGCTVCCTVCEIPDLPKPADVACQHLEPAGCGIYPDRPGGCRTFFCGWRRLPWLTNNLRPDRSGVMFTLEVRPDAPNPFDRRCIVARWVRGGPDDDRALAARLLALLRRRYTPAFFSAAGTRTMRLVHPSPAIYRHILAGTMPGGAADAEVLRWRQALLG
ncbi:MAG: hypothetical protein B7Z08_00065 [Sphingomonadales bacterium 32-68-7]|nr:MAG: hypothetical protein B7Z33_08290 [Sphingomonadales bacterium 12-68-11]OYX10629.1 MAG: hypothetical protein B7Z08_00065 [Sphingomonadales bacterium 32-68-7]